MRFPVSWWSDKENTAFPGNTIFIIKRTRGEELHQVVTNLLLEVATQNQVVKRCPLNILKEVFIFVPLTIKHEHFAV